MMCVEEKFHLPKFHLLYGWDSVPVDAASIWAAWWVRAKRDDFFWLTQISYRHSVLKLLCFAGILPQSSIPELHRVRSYSRGRNRNPVCP